MALTAKKRLTPVRLTRNGRRTSLKVVREQAFKFAATATDRSRLAFAQAFCFEAVSAFWSALPESSSLALPIQTHAPDELVYISQEARSAAHQLGSLAAELPISEAAYELGSIYTLLQPVELRARHGVFYTPPLLAERLLAQAEAAGLDWRTARMLDPAAGAGAFLIPAAQRIARALSRADPAILLQAIAARLQGWELDPFAGWLGQVFVEATVLDSVRRSGRRLDPVFIARDSLEIMDQDDSYDLVIGNPPYGRRQLPARLRSRFVRGLYGHANLYGIFTELAVRLTRPGGLVALLTPASFLSGEYFKNLRAVLAQEAPPINVDFVETRKGVFEGVLQETVLATYRRSKSHTAGTVHFIACADGSRMVPQPAGTFTLPTKCTDPWILPRHKGEETLAARLRVMRHRLADWGYAVSTGPLVWNRHKSQLRDHLENGNIPIIWAESVSSNGLFSFRSEKKNHKPALELRAGDEWLVVDRPCVLLQRTTAKEQTRRLIVAEMPASFLAQHPNGVAVENHLNMLLPQHPEPPVSPAVLAAFLNSIAADRAFRCLSGSVAVSAYELESLPLPSPDDLNELDFLISMQASRNRIEAGCAKLYEREFPR